LPLEPSIASQWHIEMTESKTTTIIAWYRRQDYPRILSVMEDAVTAAGFPPTHDQWLAIAEHEVRDSEARGRKVSRVIIDPDQFIEYCRKKHLKFDDEARAEFVLERMGIMAELKR
jgi:hypothetical protein